MTKNIWKYLEIFAWVDAECQGEEEGGGGDEVDHGAVSDGRCSWSESPPPSP